MISRDTIEEVKNRMDIVDVIGEFVTLKRSGQNYKALSPFNNVLRGARQGHIQRFQQRQGR
jgi:DNA primase